MPREKIPYQIIFDAISEPLLIFNEEGRVLDSNISISKFIKQIPGGISYIKKRFIKNLDEINKRGELTIEVNVKKKNGEMIRVEERYIRTALTSGNIYIGVFHNVTDEYMSTSLSSRLAAIVESSDDAIVGKDLQGIITSWNKSAEKMYGYTSSEVEGKSILIIFPKNKRKEFDVIMDKIRRRKRIDHYNTQRVTKDGTIIDVSVTISPILNESKEVIGASAITRDITEQKRIEKRKEEFLGIASHELKTPITSLKAFAQLLQRSFSDNKNPQIDLYLSKMNNQVDKLTKLVQDLLDVSKIQAGKLAYNEEIFNFQELLKDIMEDMQAITNKHRIIQEGEVNIHIKGDKYRIGQVLINLISNAIKYSPNAEKIIIKTSVNNNKVMVGVQDFGIGIPEKEKSKLFQRFYRVSDGKRETYPGLGLGLYICREIIERQKGRLWVESYEGRGSTFYFSLPTSHGKPSYI